jgi:RHS repeat-associated protein
MTTQTTIATLPVSDAFFSKNAEWDYSANTCFSTQCKNDSRFHFTGKELDAETGYSYFGARYLDHTLTTTWMSVDPMADKYPSISPYAYCAWNPVKLVDPEGCEVGDIYNLKGQHIGSDGKKDNKVYLCYTKRNIQLTTNQSIMVVSFAKIGLVKDVTEETGLTNDELNLRATLSTIKQAEAGRMNPPLDYNSWNGSDHFTEDSYVDNPKAYARHPGTNPNTKRSASGAYQFLKKFWDSDDFSPQAQDKAAVNLMTKSGYEAALNGDMAGFINSSSKRWTSLSQWEVSDLQDEFCYNRAKELVGRTNIATPIGSLLKKK